MEMDIRSGAPSRLLFGLRLLEFSVQVRIGHWWCRCVGISPLRWFLDRRIGRGRSWRRGSCIRRVLWERWQRGGFHVGHDERVDDMEVRGSVEKLPAQENVGILCIQGPSVVRSAARYR